MTNELEKQFFQCFGIEPIEEKYCYWECKKPELEKVPCNNTECEHYRHKIHYPQITARHYLKLIKILASAEGLGTVYITNLFDNWIVEGACRSKERFENLESAILHYSCRIAHCLNEKEKHQVRTLFEEG